MAVDRIDALTRFVLPPILGGAGGLIGVYANWGIEKRRQRLARRRELVTGWRMNLVPLITARSPDGDLEDLRATLFGSPYYASLRPHLSANLKRRIEGENRTVVVGENFPLEPILNEIGVRRNHFPIAAKPSGNDHQLALAGDLRCVSGDLCRVLFIVQTDAPTGRSCW